MSFLELHSLYWPNTDSRIVDAHKRVLNHFDILVNYHEKKQDHGIWMDETIKNSKSDLIGFLDIDAVPLNREKFFECIDYVKRNKTFLGIAQVSNHIPPATHIYCAPAFFIIHKECWDKMKVSFKAYHTTKNSGLQDVYGYGGDVAEKLTYRAEKLKIPFRAILPTYVYKPKWKLSCIAEYGIGTIFDGVVYHLYESRMNANIQIFEKHCQDIIDGDLDLNEFQDARKL